MLLIQPNMVTHMNRTIFEERETYPRSSHDPHTIDASATARNKY